MNFSTCCQGSAVFWLYVSNLYKFKRCWRCKKDDEWADRTHDRHGGVTSYWDLEKVTAIPHTYIFVKWHTTALAKAFQRLKCLANFSVVLNYNSTWLLIHSLIGGLVLCEANLRKHIPSYTCAIYMLCGIHVHVTLHVISCVCTCVRPLKCQEEEYGSPVSGQSAWERWGRIVWWGDCLMGGKGKAATFESPFPTKLSAYP